MMTVSSRKKRLNLVVCLHPSRHFQKSILIKIEAMSVQLRNFISTRVS